MPVKPTYPGVYIEEVPSGVRTIIGVSTSIAAFVDSFRRAPLNQALQIFGMADFEREFGGLLETSEASYGIQQFFLNGGGEAWVVRTASGVPSPARIFLQDNLGGANVLRVSAGRRIKGVSVDDPGLWGNALRVDIDYDTSDPTTLFNLAVSEITNVDGREVPVRSETFRNLSMAAGVSNVEQVINDSSAMIQVQIQGGAVNRPTQTGTAGIVAAAVPPSGERIRFRVGAISRESTINYAGVITIAQYRALLEAAIQSNADVPLLAGATVQLINGRMRVLGARNGQGYNPEQTIRIEDVIGTPATTLGLALRENVQQYRVGSLTSVGAQAAGTPGADGAAPTATELRGTKLGKTGMYALEDVDLFNILCIPQAPRLPSDIDTAAVYSEAITYCKDRRAFLIIDIPERIDTVAEIKDWLDIVGLRDRNAAVYFPRPRISDPLNNYRLRSYGASGTMAGVYARTDGERGVWKAPAGIDAVLRNVAELSFKMTDPENGTLNPLGINCLRNFPVYGNIAWGARTRDGADVVASEWKYIPVRRFTLFLEESLYRGTKWVVFEPNDEPLWSQIRLNVGAFMHTLFRQGAFQGKSPREAYLVKCDSETTTQTDINSGIVNIVVGFAPLKPAEFVIIKISQLAGQIET
jgi:phage tail sheath protein FI